jgi:hypothetical protein
MCFQEFLNAAFWPLTTIMDEFDVPLPDACQEEAGGGA